MCHEIFDLQCFSWFEPIWAPDKQAEVFSILLRYSITKFEKVHTITAHTLTTHWHPRPTLIPSPHTHPLTTHSHNRTLITHTLITHTLTLTTHTHTYHTHSITTHTQHTNSPHWPPTTHNHYITLSRHYTRIHYTLSSQMLTTQLTHHTTHLPHIILNHYSLTSHHSLATYSPLNQYSRPQVPKTIKIRRRQILFEGHSVFAFDFAVLFRMLMIRFPKYETFETFFRMQKAVSQNMKFRVTRRIFSRNTKLISHEILENYVWKELECQP